MSNYSNFFFYWTRKLLRTIRLTKILYPFFYERGYEIKVESALNSSVKKGDIVWDIGANIGLYTKILSKLVGEKGYVRAFEPHPNTFSKLKKNIKNINTEVHNIGFGSKIERVKISDRIKSNTNSIVDDSYTGEFFEVNITNIDKVIIEKNWKTPNVIKIDVEGYELDVIKGMSSSLYHKNLRFVIIEVHHNYLDMRKINNGAQKIQRTLEKANFNVNWLDPSHLLAVRK